MKCKDGEIMKDLICALLGIPHRKRGSGTQCNNYHSYIPWKKDENVMNMFGDSAVYIFFNTLGDMSELDKAIVVKSETRAWMWSFEGQMFLILKVVMEATNDITQLLSSHHRGFQPIQGSFLPGKWVETPNSFIFLLKIYKWHGWLCCLIFFSTVVPVLSR